MNEKSWGAALGRWLPNTTRAMTGMMPILLLGLALRLLLPATALLVTGDSAQFEVHDTSSYVQPATSLFQEGRYYSSGEPEIYRPPGYPLLLVPGLAFGHLRLITVFLQSILGVLTCFFVYRIGFLVFRNQTVATMGALLCACEPLLTLYPSYLQAEALLAFLVTLIGLLLLQYLEKPSSAGLVLLALAVTAASYTKVIAYFLPIFIALILGWRLLQSGKRKLAIQHLSLFLVICVGLLGCWQLRNHHLTGYAGFSTQIDRAFYFVLGAAVHEAQTGHSQLETREMLEQEFSAMAPADGSDTTRYASTRRHGLSEAIRYPMTSSFVLIRGFFFNLFEPGTGRFLRLFNASPTGLAAVVQGQGYSAAIGHLANLRAGALLLLIALETVLLTYLALAAMGGVNSLRENKWQALAICLLGLYFLVLASARGQHRFRVPVMPLICMFAGGGLSLVTERIKTWMQRRVGSLQKWTEGDRHGSQT